HGNAADVQICRDRGCTLVVWQATVMGVPATPTFDLAPGYWFWRARPAGRDDDSWTSAWVFRVRVHRPLYAPIVNTVAEPFDDFNGDGYPDLLIGQAIVFGGPGAPSVQVDGASPVTFPISTPGVDLNGDGFTDFAT